MQTSPEKNSSTTPSVPFTSDLPAAAAADLRADTGIAPPAAGQGEIGGPSGPEPTRFGDWERKGRCIDF
jgi:hypothetical protein